MPRPLSLRPSAPASRRRPSSGGPWWRRLCSTPPGCASSTQPAVLAQAVAARVDADVAESVAGAFGDAGIVSQPRPDIMRWKYRKLMMNLGNAVQAVCSRGEGFDELRELIRAEGEAALTAAGIEPITEADDRERRADILQAKEIPGRPRAGGSSWQSLERRTGSIETDYLNGEIVLLGRRYDVATPANELIRREAARLAGERGGPGSVDLKDLLARLGANAR